MRRDSNFKLNKCIVNINGTGVSIGISDLLQVRYVEDITKASSQLWITAQDSADAKMSEVFGMETVLFEFQDNNKNVISLAMMVYEVTDREIIGGTKMKATLKCCSPDIINSTSILISSQFENKNVSDIVTEDLITKILKSSVPIASKDKAVNKITFVGNKWPVFKVIEWLGGRAIYADKSGKSATAGFLFYQTKSGYHWRAMDSLVKQEAKFNVKVGIDLSEDQKDSDPSLIDVSDIVVKTSSDVLKGLNYGSFSSRVTTFDIGTQKVSDFDFDAYSVYNEIPRLNQGTLPQSYSEMKGKPSRIMTKVINSKLFNAGDYTKDIPKILSQSAFRTKMFFNKEVRFEFVGDFLIEVGDVVSLENYVGRDRQKDPSNSGKYIVGKVVREYISNGEKMTTQVTLYNDSLGTGQETQTNSVSSLLN